MGRYMDDLLAAYAAELKLKGLTLELLIQSHREQRALIQAGFRGERDINERLHAHYEKHYANSVAVSDLRDMTLGELFDLANKAG